MSWFKLNDSLNSLKGQLSNVANVVQEAFIEGITEPSDEQDDHRNDDIIRPDNNSNQSQQRQRYPTPIIINDDGGDNNANLTAVAAGATSLSSIGFSGKTSSERDYEIGNVRRNPTDYFGQTTKSQSDNYGSSIQSTRSTPPLLQPQTTMPTGTAATTTTTTGSATTSNNNTLEDSWFWESEQTTVSSASSQKENTASSKSGSGGDLTIIPLEDPNDQQQNSNEKLHRLINDKDEQLKTIKIENAILNEKVKQLTNENREINGNIEALDYEHGQTIDELLSIKNKLSEKLENSEQYLKNLSLEKQSLEQIIREQDLQNDKKINDIKNLNIEFTEKYNKQIENNKQLDKLYVQSQEENFTLKQEIDELNEQLKRKSNENLELLAAHDEKEKELLEKFEYIPNNNDVDNDNGQIEIKQLKLEYLELEKNMSKKCTELETLLNETKFELNSLNKNHEKLNENLLANEKQRSDLEHEQSQNQITYMTLVDNNELLQINFNELKLKYDELINDETPRTSEQFEQFKAEASESESRLVQENIVLQKQIIDLTSNLNNQKSLDSPPPPPPAASATPPTGNFISLDEFSKMLQKHIRIDITRTNFEEILKYLDQTLTAIDQNKNDLTELDEKFHLLTEEKRRCEHEKETLQADLGHYELEVAELMKNNEILLMEIDNLKTGKLETISEQNEDKIIIMEKQLDDFTNLNQTLEDEYQKIQTRLDIMEVEKEDHINRIQELSQNLKLTEEYLEQANIQIENMETEKSNILFEINELKTADRRDDSINLSEIQSLQAKIIILNTEISELKKTIKLIENESILSTEKFEKQISHQLDQLNEKDLLINKKNDDITELLNDVRELKSIENEKEKLFENINEKNNLIQTLEMKLNDIQHELVDAKEQNIMNQSQPPESLQSNKTIEEIDQLTQTIDLLKEKIVKLELTNSEKLTEIKGEHLQETTSLQERITKEKNDLIAMITVKHEENVKYHEEIQRLSKLLNDELIKSKDCLKCIDIHKKYDDLLITVGEREEKLNDQIQFLREKSDVLTQNLITEQNNQKLWNQQRLELDIEKQNLARDLSRLREHLLEIEEAHTQETVELQQIIDETKVKMSQLEEETRKSNTAYTSASIRANQHTETLQAQYMLLVQQRDEFSAKLNIAEDKESRSEAALINLQCALEQFQKNKDRDIESQTQKLRRELDQEIDKHKELLNEIKLLKCQLDESKNGLLAAARISDQLENYQMANTNLKDELRLSYEKCAAIEKKLVDTMEAHADKVEKGLVKNLVIGYAVAPNQNDKLQILKLISAVLEFTQFEIDKVGINKSHGGWLDSIRNAAIAVGNTGAPPNENYNKEGLAQAFVKFLEKESQPRSITQNSSSSLLNIVSHSQRSSPSSSTTLPSSSSLSHPPQPPTTASSPPSAAASLSTTPVSGENNNSQLKPITPVPLSVQQSVPVAVQPILVSDSVLFEHFAPQRNSSSILKDILNDS